jgi:hypothetical protein
MRSGSVHYGIKIFTAARNARFKRQRAYVWRRCGNLPGYVLAE